MPDRNKHRAPQRAAPLRARIGYWFDNRIAAGSLKLIRILIIASILLALVIGALIVLCGFGEDSEPLAVLWDSLATVINAWMPYSGDGSPGYLILMTVIAIAGLLFTSVLIGIITSAIEEKIIDLKKGNSMVLEHGHTVILGFYPGEYTLLRQLVLASEGRSACVVIAGEAERDEMEQEIRENLEYPGSFRIICRRADITDPSAIERCSVSTARTVIIHPTDDARTLKSLLAVSALLRRTGKTDIDVLALLSGSEYRFPETMALRYHITALRERDMLAKMIAHSCTQTGLSGAFRELFNFEGSEWYAIPYPEAEGLTFGELTARMEGAVPVGFCTEGSIRMNPPPDTRMQSGDRLLVFSENPDSIRIAEDGPIAFPGSPGGVAADPDTSAVILGRNASLPIVIRELPENVKRVLLVTGGMTEEMRTELAAAADVRGIGVEYSDGDPNEEAVLREISEKAEHVVILNADDKEEEASDMEVMNLLLQLRDIRERLSLSFNITAEMRRERNQELVTGDDATDFVVASSMSSLLLAQLAEDADLLPAFREILSNKGSELYLKRASQLGLTGASALRRLRQTALEHGYVLLGIMDGKHRCSFNPPAGQDILLDEDTMLIVLGEK